MTSIKPDLVVAVVGLGYVGLPLAVEFGKKYRTIGYDLSQAKVDAYRRHADPTGELSTAELNAELAVTVHVLSAHTSVVPSGLGRLWPFGTNIETLD